MTTEITELWYNSLIEDLADIITETSFTSRWALVEGYHTVGTRILQENANFERSKIYSGKIAQRIAESLGKSERTINYAIKFAQLYPDLNLLPEGKNLSWHHLINKYLTTGEKRVTITKGGLMKQIEEIKKLLEHEWLDSNQIVNDRSGTVDVSSAVIANVRCEYIRYLQDQVNKITEGLKQEG
jgi:hypothetical protein